MVLAVVLAGDVALCRTHYGCGGCASCGCAVVAVVTVLCRLAMPRCAALLWVWWLCGRSLAVAVLCCLVPWMATLHCAALLWSKSQCGGCAVAAWCGAVLALVLACDVLSSYGPVALRCCQLHAAA